MRLRQNHQRGDTLIEVLFAITVFSLVVVTALAIMNQGTAAAQRSLEMTLVTQEIDNQVEALRYLHESYVTGYKPGYSTSTGITTDISSVGQFHEIVKLANQKRASPRPDASNFTVSAGTTTCPTPPDYSFIINTRTATVRSGGTIFSQASTYSKLHYDSDTATTPGAPQGLWIEPVKSPTTTGNTASAGYIDFHVRACWAAPGLSKPLTLGTIVRLYEPRS